MAKIIVMGTGAAPGVPCISHGFGACDPNNKKNYRMRSGTYMELSGVRFLIDTSPDLRSQLLFNHIREIDAVFYTHVHADHLHGIDDLREINRIMKKPIDMFASEFNLSFIRKRFGYLLTDNDKEINPVYRAALHPHTFTYNESFYFNKLKVMPIALQGHNVEVSGYIFNDGEVVHFADFKSVDEESLKLIKQKPKVMIMPLTTPDGTLYHAGFEELCAYAQELAAERVIITHMAVECDYDMVRNMCQKVNTHIEPAYDGMVITWDD